MIQSFTYTLYALLLVFQKGELYWQNYIMWWISAKHNSDKIRARLLGWSKMRKSLKVPSFCSFSHYFDQCEYKKLKNWKKRMSSKIPTFEFKFLQALTNLKNHYHQIWACGYSKLVSWDAWLNGKGISLIRAMQPEKTSKIFVILD